MSLKLWQDKDKFFAQKDNYGGVGSDENSFAIKQTSVGLTVINAKLDQSIFFRNGISKRIGLMVGGNAFKKREIDYRQ